MSSADSYSDILTSDFFDSDTIVLDQYGFLFLNILGLIVSFLGFLECARATNLNWHRPKARQLKSIRSTDPDTIHIKTNEYPSALILPKLYANASKAMRFSDDNSEITIYPNTQEVYAYFDSGENCMFGIPSDYQTYSIQFVGTSSINTSDLDHILQWQEATTLIILEHCDLAYRLLQRPNEMKLMRRLRHLELSIQRESYAKVEIEEFFLNLPSLEYVTFAAIHLSSSEFDEFVSQQPQLVGWKQSVGDKRLYYEKIQNDADTVAGRNKNSLKKIQEILKNIWRVIRNPFQARGFYAISDNIRS